MRRMLACCLPLAVGLCLCADILKGQETQGTPGTGLKVTEMKLGTDVQDKELVGEDSTFALNGKVYLWVKLTGGPADSVTVTWKHGDQTSSTHLRVGGSPWRTWAYKTVAASGDWTVTVSDAAGDVLEEKTFTVNPGKP